LVAPTISHVICSMGLIFLITAMPFFFAMQVDSFSEEIAKRELTEISDYTSNTLANLYFLANSTNSVGLEITKTLLYLPQTVENSRYVLGITSMDGLNASKVTAFLRDNSGVVGNSWLIPGLMVMNESLLEIGSKSVLAGCYRNSTGNYVWLSEGE
jgi:hypothetical protein